MNPHLVAAQAHKVPPDHIAEVFLAIVFIVILSRVLAAVFRKIKQPPVIGEILAGLLLGTSLLGQFHYHGNKPLTQALFPVAVVPILKVLANLGLVIYMFIVGLELDTKLIRGNERRAGAISLSSVILPFMGGILLGLWFYDRHKQGGLAAGQTVDKLAFVLFIGASMCVTAFPVLARILTDRGMQRTPLGVIALACAAIDDVIAWSLLAAVSAIAGNSGKPLWEVFAFAILYIAVMFTVIRRGLSLVVRMYQRAGRLTPDVLAIMLVGLIFSAWITDRIGIHFIFGAFVFGVVVPREPSGMMFRQILERLEQVSLLLLLPIYFIVTGLSVDVSKFQGKTLVELLAILAVAISGKFIGARVAARAVGVPPRRATALALLMNTRGLTELVLLSVGQSLGVLDTSLFSALVIMAVITTFMTSPLLRVVYPDKVLAREIAEAEQAAAGVVPAYRVLVGIDEPATAGSMVDLASDLASTESPSQVVLTMFPRQETDALEIGAGLSVDLAEMASALGELEVLAARVRGHGVEAVVLSRFSADPANDLLEQVESLGVDVLLIAADSPLATDRLTSRVPATLALWEGAGVPADGPITAFARQGQSGDSALALAVRWARGRNVALHVVDDGRRRLPALLERLRKVGVPAESSAAADAGVTVLSIDGQAPAGALATVRVRAHAEQDDSELVLLLDALPAQTRRESGVELDEPLV
jgi:Kef-type K+ transport system membrane component KefB